MSLAWLLDLPEQDVPFFTREEERRIMEFEIPGEPRWRDSNQQWGARATYYPRRPRENPARWFREHAMKLAALERAEGLR